MKEHLQLMAAAALILLIIPLVGYAGKSSSAKRADSSAKEQTVTLYQTQSGDVLSLSMHDYIVGAVMAQMPAEFEPAALEAQAILAATYARNRHLSEQEQPNEKLHGADMSDDTTLYQAYFTEDQAKELYGADYQNAYEKISVAADKAVNVTLTYNGEPIQAAFHAISPGATESSLTMWGEDIPYLQSVESSADAQLDECSSSLEISDKQLRDKLKEEFGDIAESKDTDDSGDELFSAAGKSDNGTVLTVKIGNEVYPAERFCSLLGLRSQNFTAKLEDGIWHFSVKGCGHLVGMSQYGANEMAKDGSSAAEILMHYFPGTEIKTESVSAKKD